MRRLETGSRLFIAAMTCLATVGRCTADEPSAPVRGILVRPGRLDRAFLEKWKANGATSVVVPLDESTRRGWAETAEVVKSSGLSLWAWVEVARNPALAAEHPNWMAATGGHHDDWRRRFTAAPRAKAGEVVKAWPWVPLGYAPAFEAHEKHVRTLLDDLPGNWAGVFLNDLQAGPSSCGCGNDQCRWALDYGTASTADRTPGDDVAARFVSTLAARYHGKTVVPVWVTECEPIDLPGVAGSTGLCGGVGCAKGDCWPRYGRAWNPLVKVTRGPLAVGLWAGTFRRDPALWIESALALFLKPPREATAIEPARAIAVIEAWDRPEAESIALAGRLRPSGWVLALDPVDQTWEPRVVPLARPKSERNGPHGR